MKSKLESLMSTAASLNLEKQYLSFYLAIVSSYLKPHLSSRVWVMHGCKPGLKYQETFRQLSNSFTRLISGHGVDRAL